MTTSANSNDDIAVGRTFRLNRRARILLPVGLALLLVLTVSRLVNDRDEPEAATEFAGPTMGTTYSVKVDLAAHDRSRRNDLMRQIEQMIDERLVAVNRSMSTYDPESELSRFNRHASSEPFEVSQGMIDVVGAALEISKHTGGAFDATVGPLVDAWGFGPTGPTSNPNQTELARLRSRVGFEKLTIDTEARTITKKNPATIADLSAIAKGYAVDLLAAGLSELGVDDFLVEIGGELRANGHRPDDAPWRIAIEAPTPDIRSMYEAVDMVDMAMATSGDYRNFFEKDGVRYAHIIDPRTGHPIVFTGRSVSVFHPKAMIADAWATALMVLTPDDGFALAEQQDVAAVFIMTDAAQDEAFLSRETSAFKAYRRAIDVVQ